MEKFGSAATMMMDMCMQNWCMCLVSCAKVSDMFSISEVN